MKFVRVWCKDCTGEDSLGCFGGGTGYVVSDGGGGWRVEDAPGDIRVAEPPPTFFADDDMAEDAAYEATAECGPWESEVEEWPMAHVDAGDSYHRPTTI